MINCSLPMGKKCEIKPLGGCDNCTLNLASGLCKVCGGEAKGNPDRLCPSCAKAYIDGYSKRVDDRKVALEALRVAVKTLSGDLENMRAAVYRDAEFNERLGEAKTKAYEVTGRLDQLRGEETLYQAKRGG